MLFYSSVENDWVVDDLSFNVAYNCKWKQFFPPK